jgi:hypothetical protein
MLYNGVNQSIFAAVVMIKNLAKGPGFEINTF